MGKCHVINCEEIIQYLPFKCKYCGGTFCKTHRLPENHDCPAITKPNQADPSNIVRAIANDSPVKTERISEIPLYSQGPNRDYDEAEVEKEMREFVERTERMRRFQSEKAQSRPRNMNRSRDRSPFISSSNSVVATKWIIGINVIFFILIFIPGAAQYILLNFFNVFENFMFQTIITSIFTPVATISFFSFISIIFTVLILYGFGRSIEMRLGPKFLIVLYVLSGLGSVALTLILQGIFRSPYLVTAQNGAMMGVLVFSLNNIGLDREMRFYIMFIPVKLKARHIIWFIGIVSVVYGFLGSFESFGTLVGMYIGFIIYKKMKSQFINRNTNYF
jgi:rhomboid family protein